jgi:hypothetical protein
MDVSISICPTERTPAGWRTTRGTEMASRFSGGHDYYVTDADHALSPTAPRVLLRCCRCNTLAIGLIESESDRRYAATKDRQFDTGEWWDFEELRITGASSDCQCAPAGRRHPGA